MNTHFLISSLRKPQTGGTLIGVIMGLLVGLGVALAVAIYVTRVPVPFVNKVTPAATGKPEEEAKRNQNWDPNAPLYGKSPAVAASQVASAAAEVGAPAATAASSAVAVAAPVAAPVTVPKPAASAAAVAVAVAASKPEAKPKEPKPAEPEEKDATKLAKPARENVDPLGSAIERATAKAEQRSVKAGDPWIYFLQIGAFREQDAAEAQRGKLAMMGLEPKMNERDLNGRPMYRVRLGPYATFDELQRAKEKVEGQGMEASTVRIPRDVPTAN